MVTEYKDSTEQSFCRQRTDEEQTAIDSRTVSALSSDQWRVFADMDRREIEDVLFRPGAVVGWCEEGR